MSRTAAIQFLRRLAGRYGMAVVLVLLAAILCVVTVEEQHPNGADAGDRAAAGVAAGERVLIVAGDDADGRVFAGAVRARLEKVGATVVGVADGTPPEVRKALDAAGADVRIVATPKAARSPVLTGRPGLRVSTAESYRWPVFLKTENLLNVASQVVVIALLAAGMTLVIVTGGIDLSVGSLVALSAVVTALTIRAVGGVAAGAGGMLLGVAAGGGAGAAAGLVSGLFVTAFRLPPFIATLGMMQVASGVAYLLAGGQSIYDIPDGFAWLGRGRTLGVPNAVGLMLAVYLAGHLVMAHTVIGRYLYAVGGNAEAARLSGVRVPRVLLFAYVVSGTLSGVGGVVVASQLKAGGPSYGQMYELYAIAAVVVGGTSLAGGSGRILGTLIGVLIISVIQNGMNLTGVESYLQKVVLGLVVLAAVTIDMARQDGRMRAAMSRVFARRATVPDVWQTVAAKVVPGHGVASGTNGNPKFPGGTLRMQAEHFRQRGLDLSAYHVGTVNVSIAPHSYHVLAPRQTVRQVKWHPTDPAEDFSFFDVRVTAPDGVTVDGLIYYPHPDTKPTHFQRPDVLELLLPFVESLRYGADVQLAVRREQLRIDPASQPRT
ncbi:ABC transporter permease [Limnoglobus roseus]|uniref:ABC transporter permease n=1 Tax=Limnoglobus roseus TaxID=2598579 RepID=A0A5C1AG60_9BACT|nr:ABC transporter permease [Limnoglobus roseus]QEL17127.1 ABC transporter permease [Limnoglobus roseus]